VPELIEDGRSGLLVTPGDTDGLAAAMVQLVQDAEIRRRMAALAVQHAFETFSAKQMAERYAELYESTLSAMPAAKAQRTRFWPSIWTTSA
jgi:glycosyltransferase involved in cell wall biosynthesis